MNINLTPAIDITFNLLIFFLVATTFRSEEGLLATRMPKEQGVLQATPIPVTPIRVHVDQVGDGPDDYVLNIDRVKFIPASFMELTEMLENFQRVEGFDAQTPVVIFAGKNTQWDYVVNCYNAIRRAHIHPDSGGEPYQNISFSSGD